MPFIPVPNVAQVNLIHTLFLNPVENTMYFLSPNPWTTVELIDLTSSCISNWTTAVMTILSQDLVFEKVRTRDLTTQIGLAYEEQVSPTVPGGFAGPALPGQNALAVKRSTGYASQNARGRVFISGLAEGLVNGNHVTGAFRSNLVAGLELFQTGVESDLPGINMVHVSRFLNGQPRPQGAYWVVTGWSADTKVDSQNGRGQV